MNQLVDLLAQEGNGAVQVDASFDQVPTIVTLVGPIKVWWSEWDSPRHQQYTQWRDAVRIALVKSGVAVYSPHRAIQGSWNEKLQDINNAAIVASDYIVVLTPPGVPADGTAAEIEYANKHGIKTVGAPPGDDMDIVRLLKNLNLKP